MRYGFFNSEITGTDENDMPIFDRAEQADFFAKYFSSFVRDGVAPDSFNATVSGTILTLSPGVVFIQGYFGWEDTNTTVNISPGLQYIVARLDLTNRIIEITTKPSGTTPTRSGDLYELYLYAVTYSNSTATITDLRSEDVYCGTVGATNAKIYSGTIDPPADFGDIGDIYLQY